MFWGSATTNNIGVRSRFTTRAIKRKAWGPCGCHQHKIY